MLGHIAVQQLLLNMGASGVAVTYDVPKPYRPARHAPSGSHRRRVATSDSRRRRADEAR
jgi:hypothetical protein